MLRANYIEKFSTGSAAQSNLYQLGETIAHLGVKALGPECLEDFLRIILLDSDEVKLANGCEEVLD